MTWRRTALAAGWIATAGWGIYYLIALAGSSPTFVANAVLHFIIGYIWARAIMAPQLSAPLAIAGTVAAGVYTRLAAGFGTTEFLFTPLGPIVAVALADASTARNITSSALAFVAGLLAFLWLAP
ncbi:MAG: hypothetical protein E6I44_13020 [Chloroflexi bacterium]|nr:MAG: hypothetical protein E6I44_13020 [Chloroflexota bacterium]